MSCSAHSGRAVIFSDGVCPVARFQACAILSVIGVADRRRTTLGRAIARPILTCLLVDSQWLMSMIREVASSMAGCTGAVVEGRFQKVFIAPKIFGVCTEMTTYRSRERDKETSIGSWQRKDVLNCRHGSFRCCDSLTHG